MSIGERIITLRKQKNISQGELAKALNISRQAVSKWESDKSSPDTQNLIQIADLLESDVEYLATGKKSPAPPPRQPQIVVSLIEKEDKPVTKIVEKPVIKKVIRIKYRQNPLLLTAVGLAAFLIGLLIGWML